MRFRPLAGGGASCLTNSRRERGYIQPTPIALDILTKPTMVLSGATALVARATEMVAVRATAAEAAWRAVAVGVKKPLDLVELARKAMDYGEADKYEGH